MHEDEEDAPFGIRTRVSDAESNTNRSSAWEAEIIPLDKWRAYFILTKFTIILMCYDLQSGY